MRLISISAFGRLLDGGGDGFIVQQECKDLYPTHSQCPKKKPGKRWGTFGSAFSIEMVQISPSQN
jgi:hypothetical protein